MKKAIVFDVAERYIAELLHAGGQDTPEARAEVARRLGVSPRLLHSNPALRTGAILARDRSNLSRVLDWTLRDWLWYHHVFIEEGYRNGAPELQQTWMGRQILKTPFDCWVYQEIIHRVRPDLVVELGVKFGGSTLYFAHLLDALGHGNVLGVDIDLAPAGDLRHPRLDLIQGGSVDASVVGRVRDLAKGKRTLIVADSDHEKSHVLKELEAYHDLVPEGSYFVVEDGVSDLLGWNPVPTEGAHAAAREFLARHPEFVPDRAVAEKYLLTSNPDGYLLRVA